jgi:DNA-binding beta-propeller fold protein YncE
VQVTIAQTGSLPTAEQDAAAVATAPGRFLLAGGIDQGETSLASIVSATSSQAHMIGALPAALHDASASFTSGAAYLFGGGVVSSFPQITEVFANGTTRPAGELPTPSSDVASATIGDTVYIVGGYTGVTPLRTILAWRPREQTHVIALLPKPLRYAAVAAIGGALVIAGGTSGESASRDIYRFDPSTGALTRIGLLPLPLTHATAAAMNGAVFVFGGRGSSPTSQTRAILSISPSGTVKPVGLLPLGLSDLAAVSLGGHIAIAGGRDASGRVHNEILTATVTSTKAQSRAHIAQGPAHTGQSQTHIDQSPAQGTDLIAGSNPGVLPGPVLIADRDNNRLLEVGPNGQILWRFPEPGDLMAGQSFLLPDDAFYSPDGRQIVVTQEDDFAISIVDVAHPEIAFRYGHPGVPGSEPGYLHNPDDAMLTPGGALLAADIKNCRVIVIRPPAHHLTQQLGQTGNCNHELGVSYGSPNGAFPMADGDTVVTEINGDWIDVLGHGGRPISDTHPPGFTYPSDTNEVRPGVFLSADYTSPGAVETCTTDGQLLWRYEPTGPQALDHPSLALPLPNGDILANDDRNDRVIVIDPHTNRIVWQYGHTGQPGSRPGYLANPDGVDLAPPYSLTIRFAHSMQAP